MRLSVSADVFTLPMFDAIRPWLARLPAGRFPTRDELNRIMPAGYRCVAPDGDVRYYERRIVESGEIATRAENWHDLFNALAWCAFPQTKAAISARHWHNLPLAQPGRRGPERDFLTVLDESGGLAVCRNPELLMLWREHRWTELFWQRRQEVRRDMRFLLLGHASCEQSLAPFSGMTAKAVVFGADWFEASQAELDAELGRRIDAGQWQALKRESLPLPFLGIPGWWPDNAEPAYYADATYFRPKPGA